MRQKYESQEQLAQIKQDTALMEASSREAVGRAEKLERESAELRAEFGELRKQDGRTQLELEKLKMQLVQDQQMHELHSQSAVERCVAGGWICTAPALAPVPQTSRHAAPQLPEDPACGTCRATALSARLDDASSAAGQAGEAEVELKAEVKRLSTELDHARESDRRMQSELAEQTQATIAVGETVILLAPPVYPY